MRIGITAGHNVYIGKNFDPGATNSNLRITEADIVKETVVLLIPMLENQGHIVFDCTPYNQTFNTSYDSHVERCKRVDAFDADLYLDVHINAGGGTGVEVWCHNINSKSVPYATKISNNIAKDMNLPNRGVKFNSNYWSLNLTKRPAMIIEGAFIDDKSDMEKLTPDKYARSIARSFGELKELVDTRPDTLYRVQVGAYTVKANAEKMLKDLADKGFNGFITTVEKEVKEENNLTVPVEKPTTKPLLEYYEINGLKIIETDPDNVYVATLPGKNLREFGIYGINGTWQNTPEAHLPRSVWGLAGNNNKAIGPNSYQNSTNGYERGTIIYYEDGTIEVKRVNNLNEIEKPFKWCIGGGMLIPDYNPTLENIASDILRVTAHTGIGYKGNRVYLIVTSSNCSMTEFKNRIAKLDLDGAVFLDGGGSTQMNYEGNKGIHSSRKLSHGVFIKK